MTTAPARRNGTALALAEERLLEQLAGHPYLAGVKLLDRDPTVKTEITSTTGALEALWIASAIGDLTPHGGRGGIVAYDEDATISIVLQVIMKKSPRVDVMAGAKARAAEMLDGLIDSVAQTPHLGVDPSDPDEHARFDLTLEGYTRTHGALPPNHVAVRYEVSATLQARITPTSS